MFIYSFVYLQINAALRVNEVQGCIDKDKKIKDGT